MQRRIVMASGDKNELEQLRQMLPRIGYRVVGEAGNGMNALKAVRTTSPEVVLLDDRLPVLDGMQVAKILTEENLAPAVLMVSQGNKALVERAREVTSAFLMRPYLEDQVYAAVEAAVSSYKRYTQLQQQLNKLQETLKARKIVERAKGILMKQKGFSEEQAFKAIQQTAMKKRTTMKSVAEAIITAYEMEV
ncbi:ANTAR domain-containing response regulator [Desulforamulus putei]|uniref:Stage 0 sporulation protein A homolog n=1 Tax=Desulforamulus putei DSM 12395 TaxID=1121429 RepID=A0A1M4ZRN6_9FIRM|nr:ANTAR domain-containing protein [Desulforamulus putei]SHF20681.1 response regulator receiver and ANTAR domain protein [Desulforamulus putei DSM 12395]